MKFGEWHIDIFEDRFELHHEGLVDIYLQGPQSASAQERYKRIRTTLSHGYLESIYEKVCSPDYVPNLDEETKTVIKKAAESVTSENGRGLIGLLYQQICIKSIEPEQSIRLHKGSSNRKSFSWVEGVSMRTIDSDFITPFLREKDLLKMNKYGVMMTRTLAENYPYSKMYKAELRGPVKEWLYLVEKLETHQIDAEKALLYLTYVLKNQSDAFHTLCDQLLEEVARFQKYNYFTVKSAIKQLYENSNNHARIFEVSIHTFMQAMSELGLIEGNLVPLSQMRSANKKHDNVGDIEITWNNRIQESWDAKYGKPYLLDELYELQDKIENHSSVNIAGFITNLPVQKDSEIEEVIENIQTDNDVKILILDFDEWVDMQIEGLDDDQVSKLSKHWLIALAESLCQRRRLIAPIDEPCDEWIKNLKKILE